MKAECAGNFIDPHFGGLIFAMGLGSFLGSDFWLSVLLIVIGVAALIGLVMHRN